MSASATTMTSSTSVYTTPAFWERLWRTAGIQSAFCFIVGYIAYGNQPGVCHSDVFVKEGLWPGLQYPRVPGHEVAGIIDETGSHVSTWKKGQRVGVGWHGGHDNTCVECKRGRFLYCRNPKVAGFDYDGGYQEYMLAPIEALAAIPDALSNAEAAPLLCAGVTTFNALRHGGASPDSLVAVLGVGGLGHLGIQFANKFGCKVAAIGRGSENAALAKKLGASPC